MGEQSHKEEMRAALRGDFERLRARRGDTSVAGAGQSHVAARDEAVVPPAVRQERRGFVTRMLGRC